MPPRRATASSPEAVAEHETIDVDPLDNERGDLPSDDECGPVEDDDDDDALAPGEDAGAEAEDAGDVDAARGAGAPRVETASATAPQLPVDVTKCKVAELKEHLRWRGCSDSGKKPELLARLQEAIADNTPVIAAEDLTSAGAAPAWEPIDAAKIDRPVFTGRATDLHPPQVHGRAARAMLQQVSPTLPVALGAPTSWAGPSVPAIGTGHVAGLEPGRGRAGGGRAREVPEPRLQARRPVGWPDDVVWRGDGREGRRTYREGRRRCRGGRALSVASAPGRRAPAVGLEVPLLRLRQ